MTEILPNLSLLEDLDLKGNYNTPVLIAVSVSLLEDLDLKGNYNWKLAAATF